MKIEKEILKKVIEGNEGIKVNFEKEDGSIREMFCSVKFDDYFKRHKPVEDDGEEKKERKPHWSENNPSHLLVIDTKIDELRTVALDKLISIGG